MTVSIHPTALIDPGVELNDHVRVGPYAVVETDTSIGKATPMAAHSAITRYTTMGPQNQVLKAAVLARIPHTMAILSRHHGADLSGSEGSGSYLVLVPRSLVQGYWKSVSVQRPPRAGCPCYSSIKTMIRSPCQTPSSSFFSGMIPDPPLLRRRS